MAQIRAVLFDFTNVLARSDPNRACAKLSEHCDRSPDEIYEAIFASGLAGAYDAGRMHARDFIAQAKTAIGANDLTPPCFSRCWWASVSENRGVDDVLREVALTARLVLVSNTNGLHWTRIHRTRIITLFFPEADQWVLSFREKKCMPEVRFYEKAIVRAGVEPEEIVYVDDNPEYVAAATKLGITGIVYDCRNESPRALAEYLRNANAPIETA